MMYHVAINSEPSDKIPPGDNRWSWFNDSFVNRDVELIDLANDIYMGQAYTAWHSGRRKKENFIHAQHIAVDLDTGDQRSDIDHLNGHDLVQMYGAMIHTTPSHTPQSPKSRIIFLLDQPIESPEGYRAATEFWQSQFEGADPVCKDPSRFFYGAKNCDIRLVCRELPVSHIRTLYARHGKPAQRHIETPQQNVIKLADYRIGSGGSDLARLVNELASTPQGSRNHQLNRLAFIAGKMVEKGEVDSIEAERQLIAAAHSIGLGPTETLNTFRSGFSSGRKAV